MAFEWKEALPGVFHIRDGMGVCMTLLRGEKRALLVDTGYGAEDVAAFVRTLTDLPLTVVLTHGHHDHALGSRWFGEVHLLPEDFPVYETYTAPFWRRDVWAGAAAKGFTGEAAFLSDPMPVPTALAPGDIALGGLTARIVPCPGHTPGSAAVYVPERRLLLTGDNWNPCTWLFFPEALSAQGYRRNVMKLLELPFDWALCAHQFGLFDRGMPEKFWRGLTDEALDTAEPSDAGKRVDRPTVQAALPEGQIFVFDVEKYRKERA